jgi:hypothetical protein
MYSTCDCMCSLQVYAINAGTYGTLQSIFEYPHGHGDNGHQLMTTSTDDDM